ncbi:nitrogenase iron protein [Anaerovirgula multivorans]|uniref:nitrogenase n=1 Tax=Anaerovirgula multivorans TaxID=312168 RepID=A0A239C847_9FIRM|nr:nitrogenase component 1 [Anaerovirgula multivorans]SNS16406.1 nitrogenase iron protein [Anaerovirgula multivorans]
MKEIAFYGKGGIGKSTISANIAAALSLLDKKALQIGCDPKHDSTRLLLGGQQITTVLDYLKTTNPLAYRLEDILFHGFNGIGCIEAGGPEPGIGCAGRGILSTFELLNRLSLKKHTYDFILYDVLGDVVCGGFAVPIRREYADEIYIVTSGEYMSLYAANNILRGIRNYDDQKKRVAGLIFNQRNIQKEIYRVEAFAEAVGLPICGYIPRDETFALSEKAGKTLVEGFPDSPLRDTFRDLAQQMLTDIPLYEAKPLTDALLEEAVLEIKKQPFSHNIAIKQPPIKENTEVIISSEGIDIQNPNGFLSKNIISQEPLHGCAFNGAATMSVHVKDAIVIGHGPKSCCHISYQGISSAGRRNLFERGSLLPVPIAPNLVSSMMDESIMVFGGIDLLREKIQEMKKYHPKAILLLSTCPAGIIGDDLSQMEAFSEPGLPVIPIATEGNLSGDYLQGMILSYLTIAEKLIQRDVPQIPDCVNIVFEKVVAKNTTQNFSVIKGLLEPLGIKINCRYLCETNVSEIQNFMAAPLNLLAHKDYMGRMMEKFFQDTYQAVFLDVPFPIGFYESKIWLSKVASFFGKGTLINETIVMHEEIFQREIQRLKPILKGKKLMIITYNHQIDWILEVALALEMDIVKIGILNFSQDDLFITRFADQFPLVENYDQQQRTEDVQTLKPDILLSNYTSSDLDPCVLFDTIPYCPDVGFLSGLVLAKRWARLLQLNLQEGWRKDEVLFQKYYSR